MGDRARAPEHGDCVIAIDGVVIDAVGLRVEGEDQSAMTMPAATVTRSTSRAVLLSGAHFGGGSPGWFGSRPGPYHAMAPCCSCRSAGQGSEGPPLPSVAVTADPDLSAIAVHRGRQAAPQATDAPAVAPCAARYQAFCAGITLPDCRPPAARRRSKPLRRAPRPGPGGRPRPCPAAMAAHVPAGRRWPGCPRAAAATPAPVRDRR